MGSATAGARGVFRRGNASANPIFPALFVHHLPSGWSIRRADNPLRLHWSQLGTGRRSSGNWITPPPAVTRRTSATAASTARPTPLSGPTGYLALAVLDPRAIGVVFTRLHTLAAKRQTLTSAGSVRPPAYGQAVRRRDNYAVSLGARTAPALPPRSARPGPQAGSHPYTLVDTPALRGRPRDPPRYVDTSSPLRYKFGVAPLPFPPAGSWPGVAAGAQFQDADETFTCCFAPGLHGAGQREHRLLYAQWSTFRNHSDSSSLIVGHRAR